MLFLATLDTNISAIALTNSRLVLLMIHIFLFFQVIQATCQVREFTLLIHKKLYILK